MAPNSALEALFRRIILLRGLTGVNSSKRIARLRLVGLPQDTAAILRWGAIYADLGVGMVLEDHLPPLNRWNHRLGRCPSYTSPEVPVFSVPPDLWGFAGDDVGVLGIRTRATLSSVS